VRGIVRDHSVNLYPDKSSVKFWNKLGFAKDTSTDRCAPRFRSTLPTAPLGLTCHCMCLQVPSSRDTGQLQTGQIFATGRGQHCVATHAGCRGCRDERGLDGDDCPREPLYTLPPRSGHWP
jgi:hypothetical protein